MKEIKKKWLIKNLKTNQSFNKAAKIIIDKKLKDLLNIINIYRENPSEMILHDLRISVRRLRYILEIFYSCFNLESFFLFYSSLENLQDVIGEVRDLDVMIEKLKLLQEKYSIIIPTEFIANLKHDREILTIKVDSVLSEFLSLEILNNFIKKKKKETK